MHMARLWDTSRNALSSGQKGYSLESLSKDLIWAKKVSMRDLFAIPVPKKDGTAGKKRELPRVEDIQRGECRDEWIRYSCRDALSTFEVG